MIAIDKIRRTNIGLEHEFSTIRKDPGPVRRALVALLFFGTLAASCAHAQGSRKDDIVFGPDGHPVGNATITVCQSTATGTPCTPIATIYTDATLSVPTQNPFQSDGIGNYHFYAPAGRYVIQISAPQISGTQTFPDMILPADPSSTGVGNNISAFGLTLGGNLTVAGNASIAGTLTTTNFNPGSFTPSSLSVSGSGCFGGPRPSIDVTCPPYNAKGDASTNDTAAIQAAITAACAATVGGDHVHPVIVFPPGQFNVSQPQLPSTAPVFEIPCNYLTFQGSGTSTALSFVRPPATRISSAPGSSPNGAPVFDCRPPGCTSGLTFKDLDIAGYNKDIWMYATGQVTLDNVTLEVPNPTGMADNSALEITNSFWFEWHGGECAGTEAANNYCVLMTGDTSLNGEATLVGLAIFDNIEGYGGAFRYGQRVNTSGSGPGNIVFENIRAWEANYGPFLYITNSTGNPASASLPQFSALAFNNVTTSDSSGYPAFVELNASGTALHGINIAMSLGGNGGAPLIQNDNPSTSFIEGCHITGNQSFFGAISVVDPNGNPVAGCSTQTFNGFDYGVISGGGASDPRLRSDIYSFNGGQNGDVLRATMNGNRFAGVAIDPMLGLLLNTGSDFGYGASIAQNSRGTLDIQFAASYPPTSVAGTATTGGSVASGTYYATMYSATGFSGNCNSDQSAPSIQSAGISLSGANNAIALTWTLPVAGLSAIQGYCVAISTTPNLNNNFWVPNQTNNVFVSGAGTTSYTVTALPSTGGGDSLTSTLAPAHRFTPSSLGINNTNPQFNLDVNGSAAVNALNGVQKAERFTGADAGAKITACLAAAAVSTASSVCDARGMTGTLTGAQHITIPAGTVLLWGQGQLTITDTTTNDAVELTGDGASIKGYQESGTGTVAKPDTSGFSACGNAGCTTVKNPNQATSKINFVHIEGMALFATGANSKVIDMTSIGHSDIENNNITLGTGGNSYGIYGNTSVGVFDGTNTLFKHNNMNPQSAGDTCFYLAGIYNAIVLEQNACILPPAASTGYVFAKDTNGNYPNNDEVYGNDCESSSAAFGQICYNIVGVTSVTFGPNNRCEDVYNCIQFPSDGSAIGIHLLDPYLSITNTTQIKPNEPASAMVAIDNNGHNWTPSMHFGQNDLAGPNLLANAGFEAWSGGTTLLAWGGASGTNINQAASGIYTRQPSSSAPVDTYTQGTYNVKIGDGATAGLGVNSQCISVDPAAEYTFGVRVAAGSTSANFRPGFRFYYDSNCTEADKITKIATNARVLAPANYVDNGGNGGNWQSTNASLTYNNGITCNCNVTGADWQVSTTNTWTVNRNYAVIFRVPNGYSVSTSVAHSMRLFLLENSASSTNYVYFDDVFLTKGPMPSEPRFAPLADSGNGGTDTVYSNLSVQGTVNGTSQNATSSGGQFLGAPSGTAPSLIAQLSASQTGHMLDLDPSGSTTPVSFFDNSGNLLARNDLNAVSPLGAATVSMSNASDGLAIAPASGTTSGNALKVLARGSSATINASISYAGNVQGIFLLANRGSSIGPSNITLSSGWGSAASVTASGTSQRFTASVTASGTTAANPTIAINFTNTWPLTPIFICKMVGGTGAVANVTGENTATTGSMTLTYNGTPGSSSTYIFNCHGE